MPAGIAGCPTAVSPIPGVRAAPFGPTCSAACYGAMATLNPALPNMELALIGWKSYFWYIPLVIIVPHLFRSAEEMRVWLERYALLVIPVALLGITQFFSSADSPINQNVE